MKINRQHVLDKYDCHCAYCGEVISLKTMQVDHMVPKCSGGTDDFDNLNPACGPCNNFKNVWSIEEFRTELSAQVERARKYSVNFRMAERFRQIRVDEKPVVFYFELPIELRQMCF